MLCLLIVRDESKTKNQNVNRRKKIDLILIIKNVKPLFLFNFNQKSQLNIFVKS
uniref:Uncharacterized protein n=1 Tax=Meloidogyne enterolobii TaxID=390850 RepID=A0A6V7TT32_MELEN|nr:unnamed protein product [Meloidogyne enterolobii]